MGKIISVLVRIHFFSEQPLTEFSSELKKIFPTFNKQLQSAFLLILC